MEEVQRKVDLIRLLSEEETEDFLIRNDGAKVTVEDVCGKTVGLYFFRATCPMWAHDFTGVLVKTYKELSSENVEIVFASPEEDKTWAKMFLSLMPWLSIPSYDSKAVDKLHKTFQVTQYPYLVFVDGDGNVSENDWIKIVQDYGSEAYPFTGERLIQLQEEDRRGKENCTLKSLLGSSCLISNEEKQISVNALEGKTVSLFVVAGSSLHVKFTDKLVSWYDQLKKEKDGNFEIVTIYGDEDVEDYRKTLPWLVLPFSSKTFRKLIRFYKPSASALPMLVIFDSDGKPLHPDHVFTPEKLAELEQTVKAITGSALTSYAYRIRMTPRDKKVEMDQRIHFRKILVAMKGGPCSGKSRIADAISNSLRCTVIRFDEILDRFRSDGESTKPPPGKCSRLYDLAFITACNLALDQLLLKRPVVIDSPLDRRSHLDKFTQLAKVAECKMVAIVECKPRDDFEQKRWFEKRGRKDIDQLAESDQFPAGVNINDLPIAVSWLDVDTTSGTLRPDFAGSAIRDLTYYGEARRVELTNWSPVKPLHEALLKEDGWRQPGFDAHRDQYHYKQGGNVDLANKHRVPPATEPGYETGQKTKDSCCEDGHFIVIFREQGLPYETNCRVCRKLICGGEPAYSCVHCKTALHKSCAENREKAMIIPKNLPLHLKVPKLSYWYPHRILQQCQSCLEKRKKPNHKCESCLFETHFTAGFFPTIVHHECHSRQAKKDGHFLTFWVTSTTHKGKYTCLACARPGNFVGYVCHSCTQCYFHVECVLLPRPGINVHGGYRHAMEIRTEWEDESDEYVCRECWEVRKPGCWFYYCEDCDYPLHTYCLKFTDNN